MRNPAPRKPRARSPQTPCAGGLTAREKTTLVLIARDAFHYQAALGNIAPGDTPDAFRRREILTRFGVAGASALTRDDWRNAAAHFFTLGGRPDDALDMLSRTGQKSYRPTGKDDTWESCEAIVADMRQALALHASADLAPGMSRIHEGWLLSAARQRARKPTLTMDTMAERLDPKTLDGLRAHLRNHIALREGRDTDRRAKRVYPSKPDPGEIEPSPGDPF